MIGTIKYIARVVADENNPLSDEVPVLPGNMSAGTFDEFITWLWSQKEIQFDIETNICKWWNEFDIISMQFGSCSGPVIQWFLQWSELTNEQKIAIKEYLENQYRTKLIHNAMFEYVVCRFHGIIIENVFDTMLAEKILRGGMELENYALADISWKYLRIMMDKTLQKSFGNNIITPDKIIYGITDVAYLKAIKAQQMFKCAEEGLLNVFGLEMEAVLSFGDITYEGMLFDFAKWRENIALAQPIVDKHLLQLNSWILSGGKLHDVALRMEYVSNKDRVQINYNSWQQIGELLQLIFPDIPGTSQVMLKKFSEERCCTLEPMQLALLQDIRLKDYDKFRDYLIEHHYDYLVEHQYLIPADTVTINWNSDQQVLPLFQILVPKLSRLAEEERNRHPHAVLTDFENYMKALQLVTKLGEQWIEKYVGPDGKVRTNFNQVVSTGRVGSSNPNMQNIIVTEEVGTRYRNAFICEPGWTFVDSDYTGQELALIAKACNDPIWLGAIARGEDIHSIVAELMFAEKWKAGTQEGCAYYAMKVNADGQLVQAKQKCSCKVHKQCRYDSKAIDFGLAYGMTIIKLAADLKISRIEAQRLLDKFFEIFPGIKITLDFLGQFGVMNGYIMTLAPFNRKRWFPYWRENYAYREVHCMGIKHIGPLGDIERASKNHPFQGSAADMMKLSMVLVRNYIRDNNLRHKVKFQMQVHDQLTTKVPDEYAPEWIPILDSIMNEAATLIIPSGILKAETMSSPVWTK